MRNYCLIALLLLGTALATLAQYTNASATITDSTGNPYANCHGTVSFVNQSSKPQQPLLSGSVFQTEVPISACDSLGYMTVRLADNNRVAPTPSQWRFTICAGDGKQVCYTKLATVTGSTQDLTATLTSGIPLAPLVGNKTNYIDFQPIPDPIARAGRTWFDQAGNLHYWSDLTHSHQLMALDSTLTRQQTPLTTLGDLLSVSSFGSLTRVARGNNSDVLTADDSSGLLWKAPGTIFTPGGDLSGTATSQTVTGLLGASLPSVNGISGALFHNADNTWGLRGQSGNGYTATASYPFTTGKQVGWDANGNLAASGYSLGDASSIAGSALPSMTNTAGALFHLSDNSWALRGASGNGYMATTLSPYTTGKQLMFDSNGNVVVSSYNVGSAARMSLTAPASSTSACTQGDLSYDADYLYVCISSNLWRRVALSAF